MRAQHGLIDVPDELEQPALMVDQQQDGIVRVDHPLVLINGALVVHALLLLLGFGFYTLGRRLGSCRTHDVRHTWL